MVRAARAGRRRRTGRGARLSGRGSRCRPSTTGRSAVRRGCPIGLQVIVSVVAVRGWRERVSELPGAEVEPGGLGPGERVGRRLVELAGAKVVVVKRRRGLRHAGVLVLEPGVEPLELERVDVDARAVEVLPRADDQLVAAGASAGRAASALSGCGDPRRSGARRSWSARRAGRCRTRRRPGRRGCGWRRPAESRSAGCGPASRSRRRPRRRRARMFAVTPAW